MEMVFGKLPVLETGRLRLRHLTLDDADDIFQYGQDPRVTQYLAWETHRSILDSLQFIEASISQYDNLEPAPWGIALKETGRIIGTGGFISWRPEHGRGEIGYALTRSYWGQGYMTEAVAEIIRFGFEILNLNRIQAMCEPANIGSARVMEKSGMSYEGILRRYMVQHGEFCDMKIYSILRNEWPTGRKDKG